MILDQTRTRLAPATPLIEQRRANVIFRRTGIVPAQPFRHDLDHLRIVGSTSRTQLAIRFKRIEKSRHIAVAKRLPHIAFACVVKIHALQLHPRLRLGRKSERDHGRSRDAGKREFHRFQPRRFPDGGYATGSLSMDDEFGFSFRGRGELQLSLFRHAQQKLVLLRQLIPHTRRSLPFLPRARVGAFRCPSSGFRGLLGSVIDPCEHACIPAEMTTEDSPMRRRLKVAGPARPPTNNCLTLKGKMRQRRPKGAFHTI